MGCHPDDCTPSDVLDYFTRDNYPSGQTNFAKLSSSPYSRSIPGHEFLGSQPLNVYRCGAPQYQHGFQALSPDLRASHLPKGRPSDVSLSGVQESQISAQETFPGISPFGSTPDLERIPGNSGLSAVPESCFSYQDDFRYQGDFRYQSIAVPLPDSSGKPAGTLGDINSLCPTANSAAMDMIVSVSCTFTWRFRTPTAEGPQSTHVPFLFLSPFFTSLVLGRVLALQ